jgi:hypothetical protein
MGMCYAESRNIYFINAGRQATQPAQICFGIKRQYAFAQLADEIWVPALCF